MTIENWDTQVRELQKAITVVWTCIEDGTCVLSALLNVTKKWSRQWATYWISSRRTWMHPTVTPSRPQVKQTVHGVSCLKIWKTFALKTVKVRSARLALIVRATSHRIKVTVSKSCTSNKLRSQKLKYCMVGHKGKLRPWAKLMAVKVCACRCSRLPGQQGEQVSEMKSPTTACM